MIISKINLDFANNMNIPTVYAKQGDINSRMLQITPLQNGEPMAIESDVIITINIKKPNGSAEILSAYLSNNFIKANYTKSALDVAGMAIAEVELTQNNKRIASQLFFIAIEPSAAYSTKNGIQGRYLECFGLKAVKAMTEQQYKDTEKESKTLYIVENATNIILYFNNKTINAGETDLKDLSNFQVSDANKQYLTYTEVEENG